MTTPTDSGKPTPIALLACGSRDTTVLEMILQRFLAGEFVVVPASRASMAIIDGDSAGAQKSMTTWRQHQPQAVTVVLTLQPGKDEGGLVHFLKPIDVDGLVAVLKKAKKALADRPAPAVPAPATAAAPRTATLHRPAAATPAVAAQPAAAAPPVAARPVEKAPAAAAPAVVARPAYKAPAPIVAPQPIAPSQVALVSEAHDLEGRDYCGSAEDLPSQSAMSRLQPRLSICMTVE